MYCPIECRSAVSVTLAGKIPLPLLALALAVELLPPLGHIKQLRIVAAQNLDLAALAIERRPRGSVKSRRDSRSKGTSVPVACSISCAPRTNSLDPDAGGGQRQQADGRQHRIASADIIGNLERGIAFLRRKCPQGSALGVGHGDDPLGRLGLAVAPTRSPL